MSERCCSNCVHWSQDDHPEVPAGDMRRLTMLDLAAGCDPGPIEDQLGRCLRYPPRLDTYALSAEVAKEVMEEEIDPGDEDEFVRIVYDMRLAPYVFCWPVTTGGDRCGEFSAKPQEVVDE